MKHQMRDKPSQYELLMYRIKLLCSYSPSVDKMLQFAMMQAHLTRTRSKTMTQKWDYYHIVCMVRTDKTQPYLALMVGDSKGYEDLFLSDAFSDDEGMVDAWYHCLGMADKELFETTEVGGELVAVTQHPLQVVVSSQSMRTFPAYYFKIKHEDM
ncbi:MAG: hypothetical protein AAFV98_18085 [Chloroflexota bacterium]